jgi:hypothetical protein
MDHDLIAAWLGLPPGAWPPDHYVLLGLEPGASDAARIEHQVHQRLDAVRRYQMRHPEQATEAMNRIAQAFVCLTDPVAKKIYDDALLGVPVGPSDAASDRLLLEAPTVKSWSFVQQPARRPSLDAAPTQEIPPLPTAAVVELPPEQSRDTLPPIPVIALPPPEPDPVDPVIEAAESPSARRGLNTRRSLYRRIAKTRELIHAWTALGKYLASPKRKLRRPAEATDLIRQLENVQHLLTQFPPLMGEAGQPGYLVLALAQLVIVPTFQTLSLSQREALSRDWKSGGKLLEAHRAFLRREASAMRRRPFGVRLSRAIDSFINDHFGVVLIGLGMIAVVLTFCRVYFFER